jgi:MFS family permease
VQWGWRIPFLIGALLAFGLVFYYVRSVSESELFEEGGGGSESGLKELFKGQNLRNFVQVFVLMSGFWLTLQTASTILPGLLADPVGLSKTNVTITLVIANVILAGGYIVAGVTSQRIGRRAFLIANGVIMAIVGTFLYWLLLATTPQSLFGIIVLTTIVVVLVISPWGLATSYINERFHTSVRASGFGVGYSLAVILPSLYAYYQAGLAAFMPFEYTVLVLLVIGALLIVAGAVWGPETKDVDFGAEEQTLETTKEADERAPEASREDQRTAPGSDRTVGSS